MGYSPFAHSSVILNKKRLINIGCYDEFFKKSQDYDLWLRMTFYGYKFHVINLYLTNVRVHKDSITNSEIDYFSFLAYIKYQCLENNLESKFQSGMTWDNWALDGWHIDHIKPLASFDLTDRNQLLEACNYTNLQPLWAKDNLSKGAKTV